MLDWVSLRVNTNLQSHITYEVYLAFVYSTVSSCDSATSLAWCCAVNRIMNWGYWKDCATVDLISDTWKKRMCNYATNYRIHIKTKTAFFCLITQRVVAIAYRLLGQPIGPVFKGQDEDRSQHNTLFIPKATQVPSDTKVPTVLFGSIACGFKNGQ
jgi:hypothetical protein